MCEVLHIYYFTTAFNTTSTTKKKKYVSYISIDKN